MLCQAQWTSINNSYSCCLSAIVTQYFLNAVMVIMTGQRQRNISMIQCGFWKTFQISRNSICWHLLLLVIASHRVRLHCLPLARLLPEAEKSFSSSVVVYNLFFQFSCCQDNHKERLMWDDKQVLLAVGCAQGVSLHQQEPQRSLMFILIYHFVAVG